MAKRKRKLPLCACDRCGGMMLWTFAFIGCEWFCPTCGRTGGMLDVGKEVPWTPARAKRHASLKRRFERLRPHLFMGGEMLKRCKRCCPPTGAGECHIRHMTADELIKMYRARRRLEMMMAPEWRDDEWEERVDELVRKIRERGGTLR